MTAFLIEKDVIRTYCTFLNKIVTYNFYNMTESFFLTSVYMGIRYTDRNMLPAHRISLISIFGFEGMLYDCVSPWVLLIFLD